MLYFLCLVAIGLALWNRTAIDRLSRSIHRLEVELALLRPAPAAAGAGMAVGPQAPDTSPAASAPAAEPVSVGETVPSPAFEDARTLRRDEESSSTEPEPRSETDDVGMVADLERQFGARMPVWIGAIALALAGFFLVRYTIEIGLLTETVRVALGGIFGLTLLAAGHWASRKASLANGERIGQALLGAGIADLYASLFVATALYHLLSPLAGFIGMAAVTAGAVALSLRHGAPIAVLGLVGGFLTPIMTGSTEPNAPLLFGYLYCLFAGFFAVIRKRGWWLLATPTVLVAFGWILLWAESGFDPEDAIWPLLYVIAISATVAFASERLGSDEANETVDFTDPVTVLRCISLGGGVLLAGVIAGLGGFDAADWSLFGLLTVGTIALAALKPRVYSFAPIAALAISFAMFAAWGMNAPEPLTLGIALVAFGLLYCVSGYALMWRSPIKAVWGTLIAAAGLGYYLVAYVNLRDEFAAQWPGFPIWAALAFVLALGAAWIVAEILRSLQEDEPARAWLLDVFATAAACFITIGFAIELSRQSLYVAVAAEVLAAAWLATKLPVRSLKPIGAALLVLFGVLLLPELTLFAQLAANDRIYRYARITIDWPIVQFGGPALMFLAASLLLRRQNDGALVRVLEAVTAALLGAMIYCLTRQAFHPGENALLAPASFMERGVITNIFYLTGLVALWLGRRHKHVVWTYSGVAFAAIALCRLTFHDLLVLNPAWSHQFVGEWPLINGLALTYGLPIVWSAIAAREIRALGWSNIAAALNGLGFVLLFVLVTLDVRQVYWGGYLDGVSTVDSEIYAYSAAWLLLGVALLVAGTILREQMIRIASLVVMLIAVGKVFLIDASSLEGLFRVASFFGLGVTLIALSWFYTRYVFVDKEGRPATTPRRTARSAQ